MFIRLLISKYLRRKLAPIFATLAVVLCTAMVIVVISVMGGFLTNMRAAVQTLESDVTISAPLEGFARYDELIERLEALPQIEAATPVMHSFGLLKMDDRVHTVEVLGIRPREYDRVTRYRDSLHWSTQDYIDDAIAKAPPEGQRDEIDRRVLEARLKHFNQMDLTEAGMTFTPPQVWSLNENNGDSHEDTIPGGAVPGIHISPYNKRDESGQYAVGSNSVGAEIVMTLVPITRGGGLLEPTSRRFAVVNEFKSGLYEIDANRVYLPFDAVQVMMRMDAAEEVDFNTGEPTGNTIPPRTSRVVVKGAAGLPLGEIEAVVREATQQFMKDHPGLPVLFAYTWEQKHATLLGAVEGEKGLLVVLFSFISLVAVVMIGVIFYMIVLEKTRDIGIMRALGASQFSVAGVFLGYGLVIGIIGAGLGLALALSIVWNLNEIQALLHAWFGFQMWNPQTYYFDSIPERVDPTEAAVITLVAVVCSVLGSVVPAVLAARVDPVRSLRHE